MASLLHEGLVLLFRNRPTLAPELLRDALKVSLPNFTEARVESAELADVAPTEYRADLVVLLLEGKPVFAIIVEVQLGRDDEKRWTWPVYVATLRARIRCPTVLLVVSPDESVARWCREPIELGHPGCTLQPQVMGPGAVPVVTDEAVAAMDPELGVLSAIAHGQEQVGVDVGRAMLGAVAGLPDKERAALYVDMVMSHLNEAAKKALEELMQSGDYEYQSDFAKTYFSKGRQEGRQEGRCEGEADALLKVLDARGVRLSAGERERILGCRDSEQLLTWILKAVRVRRAAELFAASARKKAKAARAKKKTGRNH